MDTPGVGSVVVANSDNTRRFVPHVDAAILVLGSDPPITADELALVRDIAPTVRDIIVIFNKADRSSAAERAAAIGFTERILDQALGHGSGDVLQVSAKDRIESRNADGDWDRLVDRLSCLAASGGSIVAAALEREKAILISALRSSLSEQRAALLRPIQDSELRLTALRGAVMNAERSLNDLTHLLNAEQGRLVARFVDQRERFVDRTLEAAKDELRAAVARDPKDTSRLRPYAVEQAQVIAHRWLEQWRRELEPYAAALYREAEERFVELINQFRERLIETAGLPGLPYAHAAPGFRVKSGFYYTEMMSIATGSPLAWVLDHGFPRWRRHAIQRRVAEYLERLLEVNSARIKNDFDDRLTESRRHFEHEMRGALHSLIVTAETAVCEARRIHAAGASAINTRVEVIEKLQKRLDGLERRDQEEADGRLA